MHLRRRLIILVALAVVACALACVWPRTSYQNPSHRGRHVSDWVHDALNDDWEQNPQARDVVRFELRDQAVQSIVKAVRAQCYSDTFWFLLKHQYRLPPCLWLLKEPPNPGGSIDAAGILLSQMGEAARPAAPVLGRALRQSAMHAWERQEVLRDLDIMGPIASGALPYLRRLQADLRKNPWPMLDYVIFDIAQNTNTLAQDLQRILSSNIDEIDLEQRLWFYKDENLLRGLLPTLCGALTERNRSLKERRNIVLVLSDLETTNQLPRRTLEALVKGETDGGLKQEVEKALQKLNRPKNENTPESSEDPSEAAEDVL